MQDADDVEAINRFFHDPGNAPKTPTASAAFNEWVTWYEDNKPGIFGFWSDADVDHARNLRNAYNRANAVTSAEKQAVENQIKTGISLEQAQGQTDRRNAQGDIVEQPPGVTHQWWFWPAVGAVAAIVVVEVIPRAARMYVGAKVQ